MADVIVCGRCGARSWAGAIRCQACGGSLTSDGQVVVPPGQPPTPFAPPPPAVPVVPLPFAPPNPPAVAPPGWPVPGAPPPGPFTLYGAPSAPPWYGAPGPHGAPPAGYNPGPPTGTVAGRPIGIAILSAVEIGIGLVGLLIAYDLFYWADYRFTYDGGWSGTLDLVLALAYLATSTAALAIASGLWSMKRWAWLPACLLSIVLLGFIVFSVFEWGVTVLDMVGATAHVFVLAYLNTNPVRRLFGRSPSTSLQGPN